MVSRSHLLASAAALVFVGGCQLAPPPAQSSVASAPVKQQPIIVQPQADDDQVRIIDIEKEHGQPTDQVTTNIKGFLNNLPPTGEAAANDVPDDGSASKPNVRPRRETRPLDLATKQNSLQDKVNHPADFIQAYAGAPAPAPAPAPTPAPTSAQPLATTTAPQPIASPPLPITPSPRVQTLAAAVTGLTANNLPENIDPADDFKHAQSAGGVIAPELTTMSLEDRLRYQAHEHPRDVLSQLDWELMCTLKEDPLAGFTSVAMLPNRDRELLSSLVDGLRNYRAALRTGTDPVFAQEIAPLLKMCDRIRSQAELDLPVIEICKSVERYGTYETMDTDHFQLGRRTQFVVYCEVENFVPEMDTKRTWQTRLSQKVEIFSDTGTEVWSDAERDVSDTCRRPRRDFYVFDKVTLPPTLPVGRYTLKITVTDLNAKKFNQTATEFGIVGPTEVPKPVTPPPVIPYNTAGPNLWPGQNPGTILGGGGTLYEPAIAK